MQGSMRAMACRAAPQLRLFIPAAAHRVVSSFSLRSVHCVAAGLRTLPWTSSPAQTSRTMKIPQRRSAHTVAESCRYVACNILPWRVRCISTKAWVLFSFHCAEGASIVVIRRHQLSFLVTMLTCVVVVGSRVMCGQSWRHVAWFAWWVQMPLHSCKG